MKYILLRGIYVIIVMCLLQQVVHHNNYLLHSYSKELEDIKLFLKILKLADEEIKIEILTINETSNPVFLMTYPQRKDGSYGVYIGLSTNDPSTLELSIKTYELPEYDFSSNKTRVKLFKLMPKAYYKETINISFPIEETMPPYGKTPIRKRILHSQIRNIQACIGYIDVGGGVEELLKTKVFGAFVNGLEEIKLQNGQTKILHEAQKLSCSEKIRLDLLSEN